MLSIISIITGYTLWRQLLEDQQTSKYHHSITTTSNVIFTAHIHMSPSNRIVCVRARACVRVYIMLRHFPLTIYWRGIYQYAYSPGLQWMLKHCKHCSIAQIDLKETRKSWGTRGIWQNKANNFNKHNQSLNFIITTPSAKWSSQVKFRVLQTRREKMGGLSWHSRNWDLLHDGGH